MSGIDWFILIGTLLFIVIYGAWKTRGSKDLEGFLKGDNTAKWWGIGISIMATQASAITFLSTPGQAYTDGMRFIQFYFGLPIAMIILSVTFIPIYYKLKVFTAYEFLESRFDLKTRTFAASLFLIQRGLAAGITIYAPAIILSTLLDWNLGVTNIFIGLLVIVYTVSGGTKAVTQTQKQQMAVMMGGMVIAGIMVINMLPANIGFGDALHVAGKMGKLNVISTEFNLNDKFNIWSGVLASFFLFMSYFGTDQSQVQRYLSGKSIAESRLGLIMNGLLKVPMQFVILFIGVMVFVFYQFNQPPVFFNKVEAEKVRNSEEFGDAFRSLDEEHTALFEEKQKELLNLVEAVKNDNEELVEVYSKSANDLENRSKEIREEVKELALEMDEDAETNDKDYIFMTFVMDHLPVGLIGLLFAVMFSAAMSSTASELNALASTTTIDLYKRSVNKNGDDKHYLKSSKWFTLGWGVLAILFATYATLFENLIVAVNLLGSLFYGTILGVFVVAFYIKFVKGNAAFFGGIMSLIGVFIIHFGKEKGITPEWLHMGFLWYNAVGCALVVIFGCLFQLILGGRSNINQ